MPSAREIITSLNITVDADLVATLDEQLATANKLTELGKSSQLFIAGTGRAIIAIFLPKITRGEGPSDRRGADVFCSDQPVPQLSGVYKLDIVAAGPALLYKEDEVVWAGHGLPNHISQLVGIYEIEF